MRAPRQVWDSAASHVRERLPRSYQACLKGLIPDRQDHIPVSPLGYSDCAIRRSTISS
jgi:hypothetical protein